MVPLRAAGLVVGLGAAATVGGALVFEHGFGYVPCMHCLWERWPYYLAAPLALAAVALRAQGRAPLGLAGLLLAGGALLGAYHAGVEWSFWPGPTSCAGADAAPTSAGGLLDQHTLSPRSD